MNISTTFKHPNLISRITSMFSLTIAMVLLISTTAFAQPAIPSLSLPVIFFILFLRAASQIGVNLECLRKC